MRKELEGALFRAQKAMGAVKKNASNTHFKSKYAKIEDVLEVCEPALNNEGIMLLQPVGKDTMGHYVQTCLIHVESGQEFVTQMYLAANADSDSQKLGAAVTYTRRFSLVSLFSLPCEDNDGNAFHPITEGKIAEIKDLILKLDPTKAKIALNVLEKAGNDSKEIMKVEKRVLALLGDSNARN